MPTQRLSKNEILAHIADAVQLPKTTVGKMLDSLAALAGAELKSGHEFILPGMFKVKSVSKPATQDRPGVNAFTKQPCIIKGKPATKKIRASALKALKDAAQ
jgi:nucleoid DNA-binding protein